MTQKSSSIIVSKEGKNEDVMMTWIYRAPIATLTMYVFFILKKEDKSYYYNFI
jgi:hypothetical protein